VTWGGQSCARSGTVVVTQPAGSVTGTVSIRSGNDSFAINGPGIVTAQALLTNSGGSLVATAAVTDGAFTFAAVSPGTYTVRVRISYTDHIASDASSGPYGCAQPTSGILVKTVTSGPFAVTAASGGAAVEVVFPPPVVLFHGALLCYRWWVSEDAADPDFALYWDNAARGAGYFSFTPNAPTYGEPFSWSGAAQQILDQAAADLQGLHMPARTTPGIIPWTLVAHDMGGLFARVLSSGVFDSAPVLDAMLHIYQVGTPNSGADLLLGQESPTLSGDSVMRRFNEVYRDFGRFENRVTAIGGDADWWGGATGDGPVSLQSALTVLRLACAQGSATQCSPYVHKAYQGNDGPSTPYGHYDLGAPPSTTDVLLGLILGSTRAAGREVDPESPTGSINWGTGARTAGSAEGSTQGRAASTDVPFLIGSTDGMAIGAWITSGSATFSVLDPAGQTVANSNPDGTSAGSPAFLFTKLNPAAGTWILRVTAGSGGAGYRATAAESSPFGVLAYLSKTLYAPGQTAGLGLETVGDLSGVTVGSVSATLFDPSGNPLQTVPLTFQGQRYTASVAAPAAAGSYPVTFSLSGTYRGQSFARLAYDRLNVVATARDPRSGILTGVFSDYAEDASGDGLLDTLVLDAGVALPAAGAYALSADLYDGSGNWISHGVAVPAVSSPQTVTASLRFSLENLACGQLGGHFAVQDLRVLGGGDLLPLDLWSAPIPTQNYAASGFECAPGAAQPSLHGVLPDEGVAGLSYDLVLSGANLRAGATVSLGSGISAGAATLFAEGVLKLSITILAGAAPGARDITATNLNGTSAVLAGGFEVKAASTPHVVITAPGPSDPARGTVRISASAWGDRPISRVDFFVDGGALSGDTTFPFQAIWDASGATGVTHTLRARVTDAAGRQADSPEVTVKTCCDQDVNCDALVNIVDMIKVQRCILGLDTGVLCTRSDVNRDGLVNIVDMIKVQRVILGLDTCS
jgi:hypothetical protein